MIVICSADCHIVEVIACCSYLGLTSKHYRRLIKHIITKDKCGFKAMTLKQEPSFPNGSHPFLNEKIQKKTMFDVFFFLMSIVNMLLQSKQLMNNKQMISIG